MFKTIQVQDVYHIGTLMKSQRSSLNYEGKGLSVSVHPKEWRIICRGKIEGNPFLLSNTDCKLAVFNKSDALLSTLQHFGMINGLITVEQQFSYTYYDDEAKSHFIECFKTVESLQAEHDDDDIDFEMVDVVVPTEKLIKAMTPVKVSDVNPFEELFNIYIQERFEDYDGIWFNRPLDVLCYQAPAGLIFDHKKENWLIQQVEEHTLPELSNIYEKHEFDLNPYLP